MSTGPTPLESLLRRDRAVILAGIAGLALAAWAYLVYLVWKMKTMDGMAGMEGMEGMDMSAMMPQTQTWGAVEILLLFVMWAVMMVAMMAPSVAPLILMFARANRQKGASRVVGSAGMLLLGYLLVWTGFSVLAALGQWRLHAAALLSPMMVSTSRVFGGVLLVAAGIFQFTPWKRACLAHCRSPMGFLTSNWREGQWGALVMGLKHGTFCLGCCWMLMALLFVAGVMNLLWVAAIAVFVLTEKVAPRGDLMSRFAGAALILAGIALAFVVR